MACHNADMQAALLKGKSTVAVETAVLCLVNEHRAANGAPPLVLNERLQAVARKHAEDAARLRWWPESGGPQAHVSPEDNLSKEERIRKAGYCSGDPSVPRNENCYNWQYHGNPPDRADTPLAAVQWWMRSDLHRETLLNKSYRETGVAVVPGLAAKRYKKEKDGTITLIPDTEGAIFVQTFGGCPRDVTWHSLSGTIFEPALVMSYENDNSDRADRLVVFVRGGDAGLWHIRQTAPSNGWDPAWSGRGRPKLPTGQTSAVVNGPGVGLNSDGRLEAFVQGADGALWHIWETPAKTSWGDWASLGLPRSRSSTQAEVRITATPSVARNEDGRLEVFVRGSDGALWHTWQTPTKTGWGGWESLGGQLGESPVGVGRNKDGRLELFVRWADGGVRHAWQAAKNSPFVSGWARLGSSSRPTITSRPAVTRTSDGRLEVFARGTDNALWHIWQTAPGAAFVQSWESRGGVIVDSPAVEKNANGRLEVFARGADNNLWHIWQTDPNGIWAGWQRLGGRQFLGAPHVSRNRDGRLEVFVTGTGQDLLHTWQTAPNNGWHGWFGS